MPASYDVGDVVRLSGAFTSTADVPTNPTSVKFWVEAPSSTVAVYTQASTNVGNDVVGTWYADINVNSSGLWKYRVFSTSTGLRASDQGIFRGAAQIVPSTGT